MEKLNTIKKYTNVRDSICNGDVYFTKSDSFLSRMIRYATRSEVSHTGLFIWINGRLFISENKESKGNHLRLASEYVKENKTITIGRTGRTLDEYKVFKSLGKRYDWLGAILAVLIDTKSGKNYCSEYVAKMLKMRFPKLKRGILPIDILQKCEVVFDVTNE